MADSTFCPVCQRKNKIGAKLCAYCGSGLNIELSSIDVHTTLNITPSVDMLQENTRCQEYLPQISPGDICIFFEKKKTPIVMHNISDITLGRFFEDSESNNLDLDPYEGGIYGVSRRHARIINVNNKFVFEDLNSTNGTWLNGQRIPASITYPLMSGDHIWLGQLKMQVCFHQQEKRAGTTLFLRDTTSDSTQLTANRLLMQFAPYLNIISNLQAIAAECLQLDADEVIIKKIDAADSDNYVVLQVINNPESVNLIHKWISPWRREQQFEEEITDPNELNKVMVQLTSKIIADIAPNLTNEARFPIIEKAIPLVRELATGSIELSFEAL